MPGYYLETYGCALAQYESMVIAEKLENAGYTRVGSPGEADVIVINTCAVRLDTEQRIAERLEELWSRYGGSKRLVVAGCLARARPGLIRRIAPGALLLAPQAAGMVVEALREGRSILHASRDWVGSAPRVPVAGRIATVMIQEGCRNRCAYCITKLSRGDPRSAPPRLIVEQVARAVERGAVEIRLTGTDTAAYGLDLPGRPSLADLLRMILDKVPGDYRIRVGMMTPEEALRILDELLDAYSDRRVYKFFHIPVQSGSDRVLRIMGRRYTVEEFRALHASVKRRYPESLFATDIIVGHPGETEQDYLETEALVRELRFERVHLAQYSIRPHTRAAAMRQVPDPVKKRRSTRLMRVIEEIGRQIYGAYVGRTVRVLITGESYRRDALTGRMDNYFPVIIRGGDGLRREKWATVRVVGASFFDLRGEPV